VKRFLQGFTLLEILVALAILAIALSAVIKATGEGIGNVGYLRDQTLASWVALNRINTIQLEEDWPALGVSKGQVDMAGREWEWEVQVSDTSDEDLRRLDVTVRQRGDTTPLVSLIAFKGRTAS
jgi:general secretion pathway protein I